MKPMRLLQTATVLQGLCTSILAAGTALSAPPELANMGRGEVVVDQSFVVWFLQSIGLVGILTLLAGLMSFVVVCVCVFSGRPLSKSYYPLLWPAAIGLLGVVTKWLLTVRSIATLGSSVAGLCIASAVSDSVRILNDAAFVTLPAGVVMLIAAFVRTRGEKKP